MATGRKEPESRLAAQYAEGEGGPASKGFGGEGVVEASEKGLPGDQESGLLEEGKEVAEKREALPPSGKIGTRRILRRVGFRGISKRKMKRSISSASAGGRSSTCRDAKEKGGAPESFRG